MADQSTTGHKSQSYITNPSHAKSAVLYAAGPSTPELRYGATLSPMSDQPCNKLQAQILQPFVVHNHATQTQTPPHEDTHTPPLVFTPHGHKTVQPQLHGEEGVFPIQVLPLNARPDPWSPECAHAFPWSMRLAALADTLDDLEPLLDIQDNRYV